MNETLDRSTTSGMISPGPGRHVAINIILNGICTQPRTLIWSDIHANSVHQLWRNEIINYDNEADGRQEKQTDEREKKNINYVNEERTNTTTAL